jgi:hypothetical protein
LNCHTKVWTETFPLITDPYFYAVTIPAVLLLGVRKSGLGAGFGSLAVPMMALAVSVPQAAVILMPVLLLMDVLGMAAFRKDFDLKLLKFLIPCGLVGVVIGALLFKLLDTRLVAGIVGAFTLLFLAQRMLFPPKAESPPPPRWLGVKLARRISQVLFYRFLYVGMLLTGIKLLSDALR